MIKHLGLYASLAALTVATSLRAQTDFTQFQFGFQLSPSISWMTTDDSQIDGNGTALGLKLGTVVEYHFTENYSISSGIGFHINTGGTLQSAYGGRYFGESVPDGDPFGQVVAGNVKADYSIQYVEIPFSLKMRTREFGYLTYYADAPIFTLGFRSNVKADLSGGGVAANPANDDISAKKEISPLAVSWGFGGGAEYAVSESTRLFGGLQFQRLFTDVTKDGDYGYTGRRTSGDPKAGINSITLRVGVLF